RGRRRVAPGSPWPWLVDLVPARSGRLRRSAEARAGSWYLKHLTTSFLTGWTAGAELTDLRRYLGERFDYPRLCGRARSDGAVGHDDALADVYHHSARAMAGHTTTVADDLADNVPPGGRVLHHGCGTGTLGLHLIDAGLAVTFADGTGPALEYLRWRLAERGHSAPVVALDEIDGHGPFDLAVTTDLDLVAEPDGTLDALERVAPVVAVVLADPHAPRHPDAPPAPPAEPDGRTTPLKLDHVRQRAGRVLLVRRRPGVATLIAYRPAAPRRLPAAFHPRRLRRRRGAPWPPVARS
ncbi:MAG TPA: hypothetical protein VKR22_16120, partial [Acidimicrobiales bacterium]|nr:hypothetical protein [Acidimicrobiales bacterium]